MRVAPVGLFYARIRRHHPEHQKMLIDEMMEETGKIAGCTHKHPLGICPPAVLAYIIYRLVLLPPKEAGDKLETIIEASNRPIAAFLYQRGKCDKEFTHFDKYGGLFVENGCSRRNLHPTYRRWVGRR